MTARPEALRPEFADELLLRLARDRRPSRVPASLWGALAGAGVTASIALVVAARRRVR